MLPASLLEIGGKVCVVDCGLGVTAGIVAAGTRLVDIDYIFLTHLHSDHVLELGPLLHTIWTSGRQQQVKVWGPAGTGKLVDRFRESMRFDIEIREMDEGRASFRDTFEVTEYTEGCVLASCLEVNAREGLPARRRRRGRGR